MLCFFPFVGLLKDLFVIEFVSLLVVFWDLKGKGKDEDENGEGT